MRVGATGFAGLRHRNDKTGATDTTTVSVALAYTSITEGVGVVFSVGAQALNAAGHAIGGKTYTVTPTGADSGDIVVSMSGRFVVAHGTVAGTTPQFFVTCDGINSATFTLTVPGAGSTFYWGDVFAGRKYYAARHVFPDLF